MTTKIERIVLHIGTRKTGSTSIQHILRYNNELLLAQGVAPLIPQGQHFRSIYGSLRQGSDYWREQVKIYHKRARRSGCRDIVISAEDFYYLPEAKIRELVSYCQKYAHAVQAVVFLRSQDLYLESSYAQYLSAGLYVGNLQENVQAFIDPQDATLNYFENLQVWTEACGDGNVIMFPYRSADTTQTFFDFLNVDVSEAERAQLNRRDPADFLRLCVFASNMLAHRFGVKEHQFYSINKYVDFRETVRKRVRSLVPGENREKYSILNEEQRAYIAQRYLPGNEKLDGAADDFLVFDERAPFASLAIEDITMPTLRAFLADYFLEGAGVRSKAKNDAPDLDAKKADANKAPS